MSLCPLIVATVPIVTTVPIDATVPFVTTVPIDASVPFVASLCPLSPLCPAKCTYLTPSTSLDVFSRLGDASANQVTDNQNQGTCLAETAVSLIQGTHPPYVPRISIRETRAVFGKPIRAAGSDRHFRSANQLPLFRSSAPYVQLSE